MNTSPNAVPILAGEQPRYITTMDEARVSRSWRDPFGLHENQFRPLVNNLVTFSYSFPPFQLLRHHDGYWTDSSYCVTPFI